MHEVGIMESTLALAQRTAAEQGASRIHVLRMRVGEMSGVVPEALEFAFEVLTKGTMADGAKLEVERVAASARCTACGREFEAYANAYACPDCGTRARALVRGKELELVSMEVT